MAANALICASSPNGHVVRPYILRKKCVLARNTPNTRTILPLTADGKRIASWEAKYRGHLIVKTGAATEEKGSYAREFGLDNPTNGEL